ncbi:hypothetical protein AAF712_002718 [Marasmius tenuissimus]|uniref:Uncharacterized protein n=1 Tax=Marasmius tenuissimus TaxID=585030 RepID=A0ABR3A935_9AGAR
MAGLLAGYSINLVMFNNKRNKVYGPPDEPASREAGMQDKTEYENKVRVSNLGRPDARREN